VTIVFTDLVCFSAWFGVFLGINGNFVLSTVPVGQKLQAIAQILYGYGYITPFVFEYENPRLKCSTKDFLAALEEYAFLDNPDPDTPVALVSSIFEMKAVLILKHLC
jgi:hypothetical protein